MTSWNLHSVLCPEVPIPLITAFTSENIFFPRATWLRNTKFFKAIKWRAYYSENIRIMVFNYPFTFNFCFTFYDKNVGILYVYEKCQNSQLSTTTRINVQNNRIYSSIRCGLNPDLCPAFGALTYVHIIRPETGRKWRDLSLKMTIIRFVKLSVGWEWESVEPLNYGLIVQNSSF